MRWGSGSGSGCRCSLWKFLVVEPAVLLLMVDQERKFFNYGSYRYQSVRNYSLVISKESARGNYSLELDINLQEERFCKKLQFSYQ